MTELGETNWDYTEEDITTEHLRKLDDIAEREREAFFERNPKQIDRYRDRYICTALCQGAALHYVEGEVGVKDFDVHFFYRQNPDHPLMSRSKKKERARFPDFGVKEIHFLRTVVPPDNMKSGVPDTITSFLHGRPTSNAHHLAEKAVLGLHPGRNFEEVIWPEEARTV